MPVLTRTQIAGLSRKAIVVAFDLQTAGDPQTQVPCPQCGRWVKRKKMPHHVARTCTRRPLKKSVPSALAIA